MRIRRDKTAARCRGIITGILKTSLQNDDDSAVSSRNLTPKISSFEIFSLHRKVLQNADQPSLSQEIDNTEHSTSFTALDGTVACNIADYRCRLCGCHRQSVKRGQQTAQNVINKAIVDHTSPALCTPITTFATDMELFIQLHIGIINYFPAGKKPKLPLPLGIS